MPKDAATRLAFPFAFGVSLLGLGACVEQPGAVRASADNPLVNVNAGQVAIGAAGTGAAPARYVIDRRAQVCWFATDQAIAPIDCCAVRRVDEARKYLTWMDDTQCGAARTVH